MSTAPAEPKVKRNKKCLVCNGERKHGYQPRVDPMVYERDPFCSRGCAEKWWQGIDPEEESERERRNRKRRVARLRKKHGDYIEVENPEMMAHVLPGAAGTGPMGTRQKRRHD